ncbi:DUF4097 family beta strand repeat-containing protein [Aquipuribacter hungaricus]|uniref:DUF4097 domain-containing protein n=1 Tax=Aquipuribacter hungaricus TaxID=545624 RepID=A0ABV7WK41_9MICO
MSAADDRRAVGGAGTPLGAAPAARPAESLGSSPASYPVDGPVRLDLRSGSGRVTVHALDTAEVTVDVRPSDSSARSAEAAGATVVRRVQDVVVVQVPRSVGFLGRDGAVDVTVTAPRGSSAEVSSRSGDVLLTGELDEATVACGSGDVSVDRVRGRARVTTGSGDVTLGEVGAAQVRSGSGTVRVRAVVGPLEVGTGSGDVLAGPVGGEVVVQTGSGDVQLARTGADVTVTTGSGDVVLAAVAGRVAVKTASGDVGVTVADGTAVLLDCSSVSGRLRSDLEASGEPGPDEARLLLRARTVSGDLLVQRGAPAAR